MRRRATKNGTDENVVCIFGDAALTNGISFEALNNIAHTTKKFIGILNDNEWSIAKNVGAISAYLNKLITNPSYNKLAKDFERFLRRLPKGELALKLAHKAEEGFKGALADVSLRQNAPSIDADGRGGFGSPILFEEMGVRYLGPIDGHDLPLLISTLEFAKLCDRPIVIHILTKKGKGFEAALKFPEKFHGTGPYDVSTGDSPPAKPGAPPNYQDVLGQTLVKLCQKNNTLVGITAAMPSGTGLKHLEKAMPDRYYDVGIAEEHAVIFAAGMATMGLHPVFGDAALTNGISFEALNNIAHTTKKFIGILNDNEWSIAKNVGAISAYLNKLITNPRYNKLAKDFENFVRRLPKGELALKLAHKAEEGFKGAINEVGLRQTTVAH